MQLLYKEAAPLIEQEREKLEDLLSMHTDAEGDWHMAYQLPLLLAQPDVDFRFIGYLIQLYEHTNGGRQKPIALARQVFARYITATYDAYAARSVQAQLLWLKREASRRTSDKGTYQVALVTVPQRGDLRVALTRSRFKDIAFIVESDNTERFILQSGEEYAKALTNYSKTRQQAIDQATANTPEGFLGRPA